MSEDTTDFLATGLAAAGGSALSIDWASDTLQISGGGTDKSPLSGAEPSSFSRFRAMAAPLDQDHLDRLKKPGRHDIRFRIFHDDHSIHYVRLMGQGDAQTWNGLLLPAGAIHTDQLDRQGKEQALKSAIADGEITAFYQPIVDLQSRKLVGFEALARWEKSRHEFLEPGQFLSLARELKLEQAINLQVLDTVLHDISAWKTAGILDPDFYVAINIAPEELNDPDWIDGFLERVPDVPRGTLRLEISESDILEEDTGLFERLERLRQAGFALVMDDFGTGYSSLARLDRLPFSYLKVDQYFIRAMRSDAAARAIVKSVSGLASHYGMLVVAEGIETEDMASGALDAGCHFGQGFWYSAARPAGDAITMIREGLESRIRPAL